MHWLQEGGKRGPMPPPVTCQKYNHARSSCDVLETSLFKKFSSTGYNLEGTSVLMYVLVSKLSRWGKFDACILIPFPTSTFPLSSHLWNPPVFTFPLYPPPIRYFLEGLKIVVQAPARASQQPCKLSTGNSHGNLFASSCLLLV